MRVILLMTLILFIFCSCEAPPNGYELTEVNSNVFVGTLKLQALQLKYCPKQVTLANDSLFIGIELDVGFEILERTNGLFGMPEPGLDGINYKIKSITTSLLLENDTITLSDISSPVVDVKYLSFIDCDNGFLNPHTSDLIKTMESTEFKVAYDYSGFSFEDIIQNINHKSWPTKRRYFFRLKDISSYLQKYNNNTESFIFTEIVLENGKVLLSKSTFKCCD